MKLIVVVKTPTGSFSSTLENNAMFTVNNNNPLVKRKHLIQIDIAGCSHG